MSDYDYCDSCGQIVGGCRCEIERLRAENDDLRTARQDRLEYVRAGYTKVLDDLSECRRLLREAVAHLGDVRTNDDGVKEWVKAARAAGGGDARSEN